MTLIKINVLDVPPIVQVDWEYALEVVKNLDVSAAAENRIPIQGKAAITILGEYAAIAHHSAFAPDNMNLAVVIAPPSVWFCPSEDGLNGAFVEEYKVERHGNGICFVKEPDLFAYTNIEARLDAWSFYAQILTAGVN